MPTEMWICEPCRSMNLAGADRCYACRTPRVVPEAERAAASVLRSWPVAIAIALVVALLAGGAGALLLLPSPTSAPGVAAILPSQLPPPTPTAAATRPAPTPPFTGEVSPSPSAAPVPDFLPFTGRYAGNWLLEIVPSTEAIGAGAYSAEMLLTARPTCATGTCASTISLLDPRTGNALATGTARPCDGYRIKIAATKSDLCTGRDGLTVEGGANRRTNWTLRPVTDSRTGELVIANAATLRFAPNARGKGAGCIAGTFDVETSYQPIPRATATEVKDLLSPVPLPDLVPVPGTVAERVSGVRTVYYEVRGSRVGPLLESWANTSSKTKYCGTIKYRWYTGDRRTSSCIKASWSPHLDYAFDPFTGSCTVTGVQLHLTMSMPVARWVGPAVVPSVMLPWWKTVLGFVRTHEAHHVAIFRQYARALPKRLVGRSCNSASGIMSRWTSEVKSAQEAWDREDYSRPWPRAPFVP